MHPASGAVLAALDPLTAARAQMEVSLAFHMIFAALGITMPVLLVIAEGLHLRTGKTHYLDLAKQWGKATALLFAVGAVSGTALSFELGLLWPPFMEFAGPMIGPAFTMEGFAFFTEAIFIGVWLYGWDRLSPRAHWLSGIPIAVSGFLSGLFVIATNAWMQAPAGFEMVNGTVTNVDGLAAFRSPMWLPMAFHLLVSTYVAGAWAVAGVYAGGILVGRNRPYHRSALKIAMVVAVAATLLLPPSGDVSARAVAEYQPVKFAAMEAIYETQPGTGILIGGIPDPENQRVRFAIEIPFLIALLITGKPDGVVPGLDQVPDELEPNVVVTHIAFQVMVWSGGLLLLAAAWFTWAWWRKRDAALESPALLRMLLAVSPLGFIAIQAGWIVTEVGRQPWTIYNIMLTEDAVTSADGVVWTFIGFTTLYVLLGAALVVMLVYLAKRSPPSAVPPVEDPGREEVR